MDNISIRLTERHIEGEAPLPSSKSISNRYLILQFLADEDFGLENLSESDDTRLMQKLLKTIDRQDEDPDDTTELNCQNAGAVIRFLTALLAFRAGTWILGSDNPRMKARPIGPLVDALRSMGIEIEYLEEEGFPPVRVVGKPDALQSQDYIVRVDAGQSSQFVSALMMVAPLFEHGLHIEMIGETKVSLPYIQMTARQMQNCGAVVVFIDGNNIFIDGSLHAPAQTLIESDWTSASYLYGLLALSEGGSVELPLLFEDSVQGDRIVANWFEELGVETEFLEDRVIIRKNPDTPIDRSPKEYDFVHHPDLAQTMAVVCAALGIEVELTGIFGLKYKETDRIVALQNELTRIGARIESSETENSNRLHIYPSELHPQTELIRTYRDHRMALSFAILAAKYEKVNIEDKDIVQKSFPDFWNVMKKLGAKLS
ncbi:3-phosphoshikimate 1-carboxyvinyltransferase [bacterium]|nr:3-phosphoshikimate 1-carboxyvinyltransferase [bacterium]MBD5392477.1 3-phosphoshikimate 1-carboxyvinyltransferase [bacterium]